jgi:hypothetical protein
MAQDLERSSTVGFYAGRVYQLADRWRFFIENVGDSAWGLAIHQQSRLIAASSNKHEVQIFAPALADAEPDRATPKSRTNGDSHWSSMAAPNPAEERIGSADTQPVIGGLSYAFQNGQYVVENYKND